jgi:hypothetical protein
MLSFLFLFLASAFANENFRISNGAGVTFDQALTTCFANSLCTTTEGCCHGHGTCQVTSGGGGISATCSCDPLPSECHGATYYNSSTNCYDIPTAAVCCDGNDIDFQENGNCHSKNLAYPDRGAKGTLLRRVGDHAKYVDDVAQIVADNITALANELMGNTRLDNTVKTSGNMFGLGLVEVAIKDIVHYAYFDVSVNNVTFDGVTYPSLKWQNNTGINGSNYSIPKMFENTATSVIDLGPLYDYATRINGGVYLNVTSALNYWSNIHHMSKEFLVVLRYYARYHYYVARSIEEFLFGQNSTVAAITTNSALGNWSSAKDTIYQQARRSTIRFSQAILEQSVLQIFLENQFDNEGYWNPFFDQYWRKDQAPGVTWMDPFQFFPAEPSAPSVRYNQEFNGDKVRADLTMYSLSGLDFFISMRNDNYDNTSYNLLQTSDCDGILPSDPDLTWDVLSLQYTRLSRFGSKTRSGYSSELKVNLWRARELGLADYAWHVGNLTATNGTVNPPSVSDLNATQQADNVYYRAQVESNPSRQYRSRTSSVTMAAFPAVLNDILIVDRTSYWALNATNYSHSELFHSKIFKTPDDGTSFYTYCYKSGGVCTDTSTNAGVILFATHPHINDNWLDMDGAPENQYVWRSRGALFSVVGPTGPSVGYNNGNPDIAARRDLQYKSVAEFINALYYHWDGLDSLAVKEVASDIRYLHNQITDAFPLNIAWNGAWDGPCYTSDFMQPSCTRDTTNAYLGACIGPWG